MLDFGTLPSAIIRNSLTVPVLLSDLRHFQPPKSSPIRARIVQGSGPLPLLCRLPFSPPPKFAPPAPDLTQNRRALPGWRSFTHARTRKSTGANAAPAGNRCRHRRGFRLGGRSLAIPGFCWHKTMAFYETNFRKATNPYSQQVQHLSKVLNFVPGASSAAVGHFQTSHFQCRYAVKFRYD